jgi:glycerol-3-phosphate acyltransferase PlsY
VFLMGISAALIIVRHKDNIRRLLSGAEDRFQ